LLDLKLVCENKSTPFFLTAEFSRKKDWVIVKKGVGIQSSIFGIQNTLLSDTLSDSLQSIDITFA
jgi:hypothetical protein